LKRGFDKEDQSVGEDVVRVQTRHPDDVTDPVGGQRDSVLAVDRAWTDEDQHVEPF